MRLVAAYHLGLADAEGNPSGQGGQSGAAGKALRPALAVLSARGRGRRAGARRRRPRRRWSSCTTSRCCTTTSWTATSSAGTGRRHGRCSASARRSWPATRCWRWPRTCCSEGPAPQGLWASRCLSAAVQRLIAGQGADLAFERRDDVTLDECLQMAGDKTAALMACACSIGAIYVGAPAVLAMGLAGFGAHVGLAFQLTDDLLGIWGAPEMTGKPVWSDLRTRKKSLPVVAALTSEHRAGSRARGTARPSGVARRGRPASAPPELVEAAGGRSWTETEADAAAGLGEQVPGRDRDARRRAGRVRGDRRVHHGAPMVSDASAGAAHGESAKADIPDTGDKE